MAPDEPLFGRYIELWREWDPTDYDHIRVPVLAIRAWQEEYFVESLKRRGFVATDIDEARSWARDYDDVPKDRGMELLLAAAPDTEVVELQTTHHLLHWHRAEEVIAAMSRFLAGISDQ